ncbi:MAG: hypothetical protein ABI718_06715 [Acidobacteriota bacterium]
MKKMAGVVLVVGLFASQAFATYVVVLRDGTQYKAKEKWTITDGKALVVLENGNRLQLDPALIDIQKTDLVNKLGLGNVKVLAQEQPGSADSSQDEVNPLGSGRKLRKPPVTGNIGIPSSTTAKSAKPITNAPGGVGNEALLKFENAYENVGIYEHRVTTPGAGRVRVDLSVDQEDRVFTALTATAFLITGIPRSTGDAIDMVEIYMQETNGGTAGRFQMTRADAEEINAKQISPQSYFVQKVIY